MHHQAHALPHSRKGSNQHLPVPQRSTIQQAKIKLQGPETHLPRGDGGEADDGEAAGEDLAAAAEGRQQEGGLKGWRHHGGGLADSRADVLDGSRLRGGVDGSQGEPSNQAGSCMQIRAAAELAGAY